MLIFGYHPVRESLRRRPHEIERVLVGRRRRGKRRGEIERLCRRHGVRLAEVTEEELSRRARGVHNGFAAELASRSPSGSARRGDQDLLVLVEDVQDPRNLGAILRICEAAAVGRVLLRDRGTAAVTPTVVKASAGAAEWLAMERIANSANAIQQLKRRGYWIYGAAPDGLAPWTVDLRGKLVLCFGGEADGLRARTRSLCDGLLGLPMLGAVESLNVSAAAAAVIYEAVRQRRGGSGT